jgi:hypothetical protein
MIVPQTLSVGSRSSLVTATAWLVMALAVAVLWVAGVALVPVLGELWLRIWPDSLQAVSSPLVQHQPWVLATGLALAAACLACAIGLLRRLEWARRLAVAMLGLLMCGQLAGLWLQHAVVTAVVDIGRAAAPLPESAAGVLGGLAVATQALGVVLTLCACLLLGWMMRRLMTNPVRQEFA